MAKFYDALSDMTKDFILNQKLFFVGTSPSSEGEVNVSPKGYDTLRIIDNNRIFYLDYHGSGNETANHLNENGKITFMWCSFDEKASILRVFGRGKAIVKGTDLFNELLNTHYKGYPEAIVRQIFDVHITKVQTSCGWGVPFMNFVGERPMLHDKSIAAFVKD
jgi:hypothetical protein